MTGLSINKKIHSILVGDSVLTEMCDSIYPLVAEEDVKFPFILHSRSDISPKDCKGYTVGDEVRFSIVVVNDKYSLTVDIAERIRQLFEKRRDGYFSECNFTGCQEGYQDNAYVQRLDFTAMILDK